jgi:hypothetical protein
MNNLLKLLKKYVLHKKPTRPKLYYDGASDGITKDDSPLSSDLIPLEPRIMFDAAGIATAAEVVTAENSENLESIESTPETSTGQQTDSETNDLLAALGDSEVTNTTNEIIFIDSSVDNIDELLAGMDPNIEVVMLDATQDGMEQIAETLQGRENIDAIHIISHGDSGELNLGNSTLTEASMQGEHADELAVINKALSSTADILIYGCNFAEGDSGQDATDLLSSLTGADVAASEDLTGHESLGGDWELEYQQGEVETDLAIESEAQQI